MSQNLQPQLGGAVGEPHAPGHYGLPLRHIGPQFMLCYRLLLVREPRAPENKQSGYY